MLIKEDFNFTQYELELLFWAEYWGVKNEAWAKNYGKVTSFLLPKELIGETENTLQEKKDQWIGKWADKTKSLLKITQDMTEKQLKDSMRQHSFTEGKLFAFLVECSVFTAYFPIEKSRKYKSLTFNSDAYLAKIEQIIPNNKTKAPIIRSTYEKTQKKLAKDIYGSSNIATWVSLAAAASLLVAPYLGAAIGGSVGVYGMAATNTGLAFLGFGSLAAGGLGMMGGTVAVMTGGSLLAYGVSNSSYQSKVKGASSDELLISCAKLYVVYYLSNSQNENANNLCKSARAFQFDLEKDADEHIISRNVKEGKSCGKKAAILIAFRKLIRE